MPPAQSSVRLCSHNIPFLPRFEMVSGPNPARFPSFSYHVYHWFPIVSFSAMQTLKIFSFSKSQFTITEGPKQRPFTNSSVTMMGISHQITSHHLISYYIISIISYHIISYHIISYHIISNHIVSHDITSHRIISHHFTSYP